MVDSAMGSTGQGSGSRCMQVIARHFGRFPLYNEPQFSQSTIIEIIDKFRFLDPEDRESRRRKVRS
jgi:hypothetical protein